MIGRNDPCFCGSGKKYKKCCALKSEPSNEVLVEEELNRILIGFYENAISSPAEMAEFSRYEREWINKIGRSLSREKVEQAVSEYFLFVARRDLWKRYLVKTLNGPIRTATRAVLETWQDPIVLFGKVTTITEDYFLVDEVLGHLTYHIDFAEGIEVEEDLLVFGVVLPDNRNQENGIHILDGLTFIYDRNGMFAEKIELLAEASGEASSHDFFKAHMLDIHQAILQREVNGMDDFTDNELLPEQQEVMVILEEKLNSHDVPTEILEFSKMIAITYLIREQAVFRKPEIIAAAVFKVVYDLGIFEGTHYSQADISKMFSVSVGSMMKHADVLYDIVDEIAEIMDSDANTETAVAYWVGTDPRMTERVNWEVYCKMEMQDFDTFEDAERYLNATMNEPFKPTGKKQQAQAIAFDAYDAENNQDRYRLAKKAYALNAENVDAVLLQAEIATVDEEIEHFYQTAIELGKMLYDDEPEIAWGLVTNRPFMRAIFAYGIWLFENERFGEAAALFEELLKINPADNQGARYIAIASFIHDENFSKAATVLENYEEGTENDAPYLYLKWLFQMRRTGGGKDAELLSQAVDANPLIARLIEGEVQVSYPKQLAVSPGSIEEAEYIWFLL